MGKKGNKTSGWMTRKAHWDGNSKKQKKKIQNNIVFVEKSRDHWTENNGYSPRGGGEMETSIAAPAKFFFLLTK